MSLPTWSNSDNITDASSKIIKIKNKKIKEMYIYYRCMAAYLGEKYAVTNKYKCV